jgi:hypothetical protein
MIESAYPGHAALRGRVGVVVPAWFAPETLVAEAARLLMATLEDTPACLAPGDVAVVVDGSPVALEAARMLREQLGQAWGASFQLIDLETNRGKGAALVAGIRWLLERSLPEAPLAWIAARDADGDHLLDDLPHLFRAGEQVAADCPGAPVCVIGRRANLHAPLGWVRGEFERLLNEVIVEAVAFARAREGHAWDTRYLVERAPDLQSGYKLYSRAAAEQAVCALEEAAQAWPGLNLRRVGMEVVPFVALALAGGVFAEVERKTWFDQPVTSYGRLDLPRFYGAKLAWALRHCGVPLQPAALLFDGALARRPLFTDPSGRAALLELRRFVLELLAGGPVPADISPVPLTRRFL